MQNFIPHVYKIECISNLHVGSGDNNYGVIDKQVQRDSISQIPVIHASGLKGALREYFEKIAMPGNDKKIATIFGSAKTDAENMQQGAFRFMEARLLSIPVRGIDSKPFYKATSAFLVNEFNRIIQGVNVDYKITVPSADGPKAKTEFGEAPSVSKIAEIGDDIAILSDEMQSDVLNHLPVIARNSLDNGQSENLWYEEVVPRESIFYFLVLAPGQLENDTDFEKDFNTHLHNKFVQIGANATVGYGCCKILNLF
jgi:CRISPR-associated protein Cmr4